jgi:nitrite reductase/ring-hydroxylating ferredoxin subunit
MTNAQPADLYSLHIDSDGAASIRLDEAAVAALAASTADVFAFIDACSHRGARAIITSDGVKVRPSVAILAERDRIRRAA